MCQLVGKSNKRLVDSYWSDVEAKQLVDWLKNGEWEDVLLPPSIYEQKYFPF